MASVARPFAPLTRVRHAKDEANRPNSSTHLRRRGIALLRHTVVVATFIFADGVFPTCIANVLKFRRIEGPFSGRTRNVRRDSAHLVAMEPKDR